MAGGPQLSVLAILEAKGGYAQHTATRVGELLLLPVRQAFNQAEPAAAHVQRRPCKAACPCRASRPAGPRTRRPLGGRVPMHRYLIMLLEAETIHIHQQIQHQEELDILTPARLRKNVSYDLVTCMISVLGDLCLHFFQSWKTFLSTICKTRY